jgi:hypothetical protein
VIRSGILNKYQRLSASRFATTIAPYMRLETSDDRFRRSTTQLISKNKREIHLGKLENVTA